MRGLGLVGFVLLALAGQAKADISQPDTGQIAEVERALELPTDARSLQDYVRYYAFLPVEGRPQSIISGVLVDAGIEMGKWNRPRGAYGVPKLPDPPIQDGGCSIVRIFYDPNTHRMLSIACNGR